jgi:hypothetical protein
MKEKCTCRRCVGQKSSMGLVSILQHSISLYMKGLKPSHSLFCFTMTSATLATHEYAQYGLLIPDISTFAGLLTPGNSALITCAFCC